MSYFQTQYALIEDVWTKPNTNIPPVTKAPEATIKRTLNTVYTEQGIAGVKVYLDPVIIRDIQAEALAQHRAVKHTSFNLDLSKDDWVYVLLGLFAILFVIDTRS
jgi:hypothetical protein